MYIFFKVCLEYPQNIEEIKRSNDKKHINLTNEKILIVMNKKNWYSSRAPVPFKEYVNTNWS